MKRFFYFLPAFALLFLIIACDSSSANRYELSNPERDANEIEKSFHFSKSQKNVLILFLDRGIGPFVGKIFETYPKIKEQFDGFTWYKNVVSFSYCTIMGAPPLYGGYEYQPEKMNQRPDEYNFDKSVESELVLSKIFLDAGYSVTLTDLMWPLSARSENSQKNIWENQLQIKNLEGALYSRYIMDKKIAEKDLSDDAKSWLKCFSNLYYLAAQSDCDAKNGAYINFHSNAAHGMWRPDATLELPAQELGDDFDTQGHFLLDAAAFMQFGKLFDYLRKNNCYDNTRIVIVSDHGWSANISEYTDFVSPSPTDAAWLSPMLLVKDFNERGAVKECLDFSTNADTAWISLKNLPVSDLNPYTGNKILNQSGGANVYWTLNWDSDADAKSKTFTIDKNRAWHVNGNIFEKNNWILLSEYNQ